MHRFCLQLSLAVRRASCWADKPRLVILTRSFTLPTLSVASSSPRNERLHVDGHHQLLLLLTPLSTSHT